MFLTAEKASLESENLRWRQRVQQVIDRYQRVDPEQHEKLTQDYQKLQQQLQEYTTTQLENIKIIEKLNEELKQKSDAINKHETDSKKLQKYIKQQQSEIKKTTRRN